MGQVDPLWMDQSFADLLRWHPQLDALRAYLPSSAAGVAFDGQEGINRLQPSYALRGYGSLVYALMRVLRPRHVVEIGVFQGFSLLSAAAGLRDNGGGRIEGFDLFDAYPYRHATREQAARQVLASGLEPWVTLHDGDAGEVHERFESVDYLHVDISNHGDIYRGALAQWSEKVRQVIVLEGGSVERDNVEWMRQYGKPAIAPAIVELRREYPGWSFTVLQPFPSWTVACNRAAIASSIP